MPPDTVIGWLEEIVQDTPISIDQAKEMYRNEYSESNPDYDQKCDGEDIDVLHSIFKVRQQVNTHPRASWSEEKISRKATQRNNQLNKKYSNSYLWKVTCIDQEQLLQKDCLYDMNDPRVKWARPPSLSCDYNDRIQNPSQKIICPKCGFRLWTDPADRQPQSVLDEDGEPTGWE